MDKIISLVSVSGSVLIGLAGVVAPLVFNHIKDSREYKRRQLEEFENQRLSAHRAFVDAYSDYMNSTKGANIAIELMIDKVFKTGSAAYLISDTETKRLLTVILRSLDVFRSPFSEEECNIPNNAFWDYVEHVSYEYEITVNQLLGKKTIKRKPDRPNSK